MRSAFALSRIPWRARTKPRPHCSIATFFGHVPWLGVYVGKIPAATGNLMVLLNNCADRVKARLKRGSEKKDLFHYLASRLSFPYRCAVFQY